MFMERKIYLIGDPVIREKIQSTFRIIGKSLLYGFAVIGVIAVMTVVCQIAAW